MPSANSNRLMRDDRIRDPVADALMAAYRYANAGAGVVDYWLAGAPSTLGGYVNALIPYQPLGELSAIKESAALARQDAVGLMHRDVVGLAEPFRVLPLKRMFGTPAYYGKTISTADPESPRRKGRIDESERPIGIPLAATAGRNSLMLPYHEQYSTMAGF